MLLKSEPALDAGIKYVQNAIEIANNARNIVRWVNFDCVTNVVNVDQSCTLTAAPTFVVSRDGSSTADISHHLDCICARKERPEKIRRQAYIVDVSFARFYGRGSNGGTIRRGFRLFNLLFRRMPSKWQLCQ